MLLSISAQVRDASYTRVNQQLSPYEGGARGPAAPGIGIGGYSGAYEASNWRNLQLPGFSSVPSETARYLGQTTVFSVGASGAVEGVTVSRDEPEWAVNFKKALVVLFQTKTREGGFNFESNMVRA